MSLTMMMPAHRFLCHLSWNHQCRFGGHYDLLLRWFVGLFQVGRFEASICLLVSCGWRLEVGGPKEVEASHRRFGVERTNYVPLNPAWSISANLFLSVFVEPVGQNSVSGAQCQPAVANYPP